MSTAALPTKPRREDVPPGELLCRYCTAKCCRYFAVPIEQPTTDEQYDTVRWFLLHDRAAVFVEDDTWYLLVNTDCKHLRDDNRCGIYHSRPSICREYSTADCEYDDDWVYDGLFELPEQVDELREALFAKPGSSRFRSARPALLPIIS